VYDTDPKIIEERDRLKAEVERLEEVIQAKDKLIHDWIARHDKLQKENEELREGICEHVAQGTLSADCKLCELAVAEKGYKVWTQKTE